MLRRLKREVMGQLPPKRRQVVRLPAPDASHWPKGFRPSSEGKLTLARLPSTSVDIVHNTGTLMSLLRRCRCISQRLAAH